MELGSTYVYLTKGFHTYSTTLLQSGVCYFSKDLITNFKRNVDRLLLGFVSYVYV